MADRPTADDLIRVINERNAAIAEADALRAEVAALKAATARSSSATAAMVALKDRTPHDGDECPYCEAGPLEYVVGVLTCPDCEWREGVDHG